MKDLYDYDVSVEWLMFWHNGWETGETVCYDKDSRMIDERHYLNKTCANYNHDVKAVWLTSLSLCGDIGVGWVEAAPSDDADHEYFNTGDLDEMEYAICITERMLLRQGVPFTADYKFTNDKGKRMARLNKAIRRRLKVDEYVEKLRKKEEKRWAEKMEEWKKEKKDGASEDM